MILVEELYYTSCCVKRRLGIKKGTEELYLIPISEMGVTSGLYLGNGCIQSAGQEETVSNCLAAKPNLSSRGQIFLLWRPLSGRSTPSSGNGWYQHALSRNEWVVSVNATSPPSLLLQGQNSMVKGPSRSKSLYVAGQHPYCFPNN